MSSETATRATPADLASQLPGTEEAIDRAATSRAHQEVLEVLERLRRARHLSKDAEGAHVGRALASAGFDFDVAQEELAELRRRLAGTALRAAEALHDLLSNEDRRELARLALGELRIPMVDQTELARIRRAREAIRAKKAAGA